MTNAIRQNSSLRSILKKSETLPAPAALQNTLKVVDTPKLRPIQVIKASTNAIIAPETAQCQGWLINWTTEEELIAKYSVRFYKQGSLNLF